MRTIATIVLLFVTGVAFGQPNVRVAFTVSPVISWLKAEASEIEKGKIRGGVDYGIAVDVTFKDNYVLSTGATVIMEGGNINFTDSLLFNNYYKPGQDNDSSLMRNTDARFKLQALNIPILFKMKTNEIGYFTYYGSLGLIPSFRIRARVDSKERDYDNENFTKRKNEVDDIFVATIFNLSLQVGAGFEYAVSDKTSILVGLFFNNGFLNVVKDGDEDRIVSNVMGLRLGVAF